MAIFDETIKALYEYEKLMSTKPETDEEYYKCACAELDISKAFVYDLGYDDAVKFARGILALGQLHPIR